MSEGGLAGESSSARLILRKLSLVSVSCDGWVNKYLRLRTQTGQFTFEGRSVRLGDLPCT